MEYSAGIQVARKDAMDRALKRAIRGTFRAIERSVIALPLTARIDGIVPPSQSVSGQTDILIGTGAFSNVKPGTLYEVIDMPGMVIQVVKSVASGSVGQLVQGSQNELQPGMLLREAGWTKRPKLFRAAGEISTLAATESIDLPRQNFPKQDLSRWVNDISRWEAIAKSIAGAVLLPYRIWRYRNYDQEYKEGRIEALVDESPDGLDRASDASASEPGRTGVDVTGTDEWARKMRGEWWARRIGLSESGEMPDLGLRSPVVAVIDTGVDYNHAAIHDQAWKNLVPKFGDDYGWDFISNDPRPYDDGYHGTAVAGHVLAVAPKARIMPLKVFNAFGITSSAAVHGAIRYAVDHGARIIVMGWASRLPTQTIDGAIEYAREKGVLIVTAAGDRGESLRVVPTYPASYARDTENVLAVANVDVADKLVRVRGKASNYDPSTVAIAAPGYNLTVAEPRNNLNRETGTGMSAAIVAGAVARNVAFRLEAGRAGTPAEWIAELLDQAERVPGLEPYVAQGHRVRIVR